MTDYRERMLDIGLSEELGGEQPPDQMQAILRAAEARRNGIAAGQSGQSQRRPSKDTSRSRRWSASGNAILPLALAVAAAVAIGLVIANFWWGEADGLGPKDIANQNGSGNGEAIDPDLLTLADLEIRDEMIVPLSADSGRFRGTPVLQQGWAFAYAGSSQLQVGIDLFAFNKARAVVVIGGVPDSYQATDIARSLKTANLVHSQEEAEMLSNPRKWIIGLGVAMCLFAGEASLNGEVIQAQDREVIVIKKVTVKQVFDRYDLNSDGVLQADECICEGSKMCDSDGDGQVTREEFSAGVVALVGSEEQLIECVNMLGGLEKFYEAARSGELEKIASVSIDSVFEHLDADASGVLETEECICAGSKQADLNADGIVTREEIVATAEKLFGSEEQFLAAVRAAGGVEAFFKAVQAEEKVANGTSVNDVFVQYDKNANGTLEQSECVCEGSKMADANADGKVTPEEFKKIAVEMFGSVEKFEKYIEGCGGAKAFYESVASGNIPPHNDK